MMDSPGTRDLLEKTRRGLAWLRHNHNAWDPEKPSRHPEEEFGRILEETASSEKVVRSLGYQGCILGDKGPCPEDAVITCDHCAGISSPPESESTPHQPPEPDGSRQLSLFKAPARHA